MEEKLDSVLLEAAILREAAQFEKMKWVNEDEKKTGFEDLGDYDIRQYEEE